MERRRGGRNVKISSPHGAVKVTAPIENTGGRTRASILLQKARAVEKKKKKKDKRPKGEKQQKQQEA